VRPLWDRIPPLVRGFGIVALIALVVVVLSLESVLATVGGLVQIAFFLAVAFFLFLLWRDRRGDLEAAMADSAPPARGGSRLGMPRARAARSSRPRCSSRRMPRRQRPGVQLPPSGKITRAPSWSSPLASRSICSLKTPSPARRWAMKTLGRRLATTSRLGSSCIVAFMTTRGRRP